jgi:hypothetical protein
MRCRRCRKEIAGIGKPALPPAIPAVIALAGAFGGLWYLTLAENPSNPMPNWSPATGWAIGLGSLALAIVLGWIGLVRRKCPECGCTQMLDPMEEEATTASERMAAQKAAVDEALVAAGKKPSDESARELRAAIEQELRAALAKETADRFAARDKELRPAIEQELRNRLTQELQP